MDYKNCLYFCPYLNKYGEEQQEGICSLHKEECNSICYKHTPIKKLDNKELMKLKATLNYIKVKIDELYDYINQYNQ